MFFLVYAPGVDWLLLNVKTVTDWLFAAVVEQQAEIFEEHLSKIYLFSPLAHSISLRSQNFGARHEVTFRSIRCRLQVRKSMTDASVVLVSIISQYQLITA